MKPSYESRLLVLGLGLTEANCCLFERMLEVVKYEQRPAIHMENQLWWSRVSEDLQGGSNSVSQVDRISDMALLGEGLEKG